MNDPPHCLSRNEVAALTFAARRQLTRWADRRDLNPREQARRAALIRAVGILEDQVLANGCELQPHDTPI